MASCNAAKESKKKGGGAASFKFLRNLIERPKSANASASQSNSAQVSLSSVSGVHDSFPENNAGTVEPTAPGGNATLHQGSQTQGSDPKVTVKEGLGVAARFTQTLLKKVPGCVDNNPVKVAFSVAKVIIEIKDAVGDNKDELLQHLEDTANRLLAVERTVAIGVPKAVGQEMEKLTRILQEEMKKLEDLARKSLAIRTLDHEEHQKMIRQIFQRINGATTSFQLEMANSIQEKANAIYDDTKKAALRTLRPSEKADHRTVLDHQVLKREECTPNTRVKILEDINKWANDPSSDSARVFWLTGQAGSGKTTIAYTLAKQIEKGGNANQHTVLGGSFLCSRQFEETQEQTRILPTIAYHLARKCKLYADALYVADKFDAVNYDVPTQLKDLLFAPWQQSEATRGPELPQYLIIIDALDEIGGGGGSAFLRDLLIAINENDPRGLKFLVTSRSDPELAKLCQAFTSEAVCRLQDVPIEEAKSDIETYLPQRQIRRCRVLSESVNTLFKPPIVRLHFWHDVNGAVWNGGSLLRGVRQGIAKLVPDTSKRAKRPPVTIEHMHALAVGLDLTDTFDCAVWAVACVAFWGCCRLGELIIPSIGTFDPEKHVSRSSPVTFKASATVSSASFQVPWTKTTKKDGAKIIITAIDDPSDPITALRHHLLVNAAVPSTAPFFSFVTATGWAPMTRDGFLSRCESVWEAAGMPRMAGHGFRIGGATELLLRGTDPNTVRTQGRWKSDAFLDYWRKIDDILPLFITNSFSAARASLVTTTMARYERSHRVSSSRTSSI